MQRIKDFFLTNGYSVGQEAFLLRKYIQIYLEFLFKDTVNTVLRIYHHVLGMTYSNKCIGAVAALTCSEVSVWSSEQKRDLLQIFAFQISLPPAA